MTVDRICSLIKGDPVVNADRDVVGFYAGDFLSHVLLRAPSGYGLITVLGGVNVGITAYKADLAAVIVCEEQPSIELIAFCKEKGISLITTPRTEFECAANLSK